MQDSPNSPASVDQSAASIDQPTLSATDNQAESLVNLERLIISYLSQVESQESEYRKIREMLENILDNNSDYQAAAETAKEAAKAKASVKRQIMQQTDAKEIAEKLRTAKEELKEMQDNLSDYLQQYARLSGTNQFEDDQGQVREIVYVAKLVKRSEKFRT